MSNPAHNVAANTTPGVIPASPFHPGEQAVQITAGVRDEAEARGQRMLTPQLVNAQREFFAALSFAATTWIDDKGQPWASLVTGKPGFIQASEDGRVRIERGGAVNGPAVPDANSLKVGSQMGLLGIEFARRRRNRINGTVLDAGRDYVSLMIDQGYGNCPKYITKREWNAALLVGDYLAEHTTVAPDTVRQLFAGTDTFFIASSSGPRDTAASNQPQAWGSDVSHRGGEPGFLELTDNTLYFDDYPGNNLYNTLGNLQQYPRCGLLLIDFATGDVVQIAGVAELSYGSERYRIAIHIGEVVHWKKRD
jgi:predicted pyridoxine 5'-phosphate oxidase superfamily flavin-nucleotide-binding protein